jgi:F0F1-type ATP synthase assembly protein I
MVYLASKYLITALVVVLVSELARRSDRLGGLIAALPLVTVLTLIWLYIEQQPAEKLGNHAWYTFWYVLPTLPMFLLFPWLLGRMGFWWALLVCILFTCAVFAVYAAALRKFGIELL